MTHNTIQPIFQPAIKRVLDLCEAQFGDDLAAFYLAGSLAFGEGWPGASDLDGFVFLKGQMPDPAWARTQESILAQEYPIVSAFHINVQHADRLRSDVTWRYLLRHFSVCLLGDDLINNLEKEGVATPEPSRQKALGMIAVIEKVLNETDQHAFPSYIFTLPENPFLATRKLARWFIIREGAHLLLAEGIRTTFRQGDVLQRLNETYPEWKSLFTQTSRILVNPLEAGILPEAFMQQVGPFIRSAIGRVRALCPGGHS
jgi:hypothetical protein